jgi:hypothetical protein
MPVSSILSLTLSALSHFRASNPSLQIRFLIDPRFSFLEFFKWQPSSIVIFDSKIILELTWNGMIELSHCSAA